MSDASASAVAAEREREREPEPEPEPEQHNQNLVAQSGCCSGRFADSPAVVYERRYTSARALYTSVQWSQPNWGLRALEARTKPKIEPADCTWFARTTAFQSVGCRRIETDSQTSDVIVEGIAIARVGAQINEPLELTSYLSLFLVANFEIVIHHRNNVKWRVRIVDETIRGAKSQLLSQNNSRQIALEITLVFGAPTETNKSVAQFGPLFSNSNILIF